MPVVRATSPGAEVREESERRAAQKELRNLHMPGKDSVRPITAAQVGLQEIPVDTSSSPDTKLLHVQANRIFHLSPGQNRNYFDQRPGIQKRKGFQRNQLLTFIEHSESSKEIPGLLDQPSKNQSVSPLRDGGTTSVSEPPMPEDFSRIQIGKSSSGHPNTWDYDSDQLVEELASFALESFSPEKHGRENSKDQKVNQVNGRVFETDLAEDFIYETYLRVPVASLIGREKDAVGAGLLVIDESDRELWQTFNEHVDDSEWDEEDPDSNG